MKILSISLLLLLASCNSHRELIGTWKTEGYTLSEKCYAYLNGIELTIGNALDLNPDSTYREETCGNISIGKWTHEGDSLILVSDTTWYLAAKWYREHHDANYDSISGICSHSRTAFLIKQDKLVYIYKGKAFSTQEDGTEILRTGYSMTILK